MTDAGVNFGAQPAGVKNVAVGIYRLDIGSPVGISISPAIQATAAATEQRTQLARAVAQDHKDEKKQPGVVDLVERSSVRADAVTDRVEEANTLWLEVATGKLDVGTVNGQIDSLLALVQKLDREGRFDEQLRLARALSRLLAVALRWLDLLRSLRATLAAAERHGDKSARAWALHELGTLHLAGNDLRAADRELSKAAELRKELGDTRGLAATERNLQVLCRTLRQMMREGRMAERRGLRRLLHAPFAVIALFALVFAAATAAIAESGVFGGGNAHARIVRTVDRVAPATGPAAGNTLVTITGTRLGNAKTVRFGPNTGRDLRQLSGSRLQVRTPPGSGTVPVTVVTAHGSSVPSAAARFTYKASHATPPPARGGHSNGGQSHGGQTNGGPNNGGQTTTTPPAPPTITGITPPSGPAAGGRVVTIEGTGLASATAVTFGTTPATAFQPDHDIGLQATPPQGSGTVTVTVTTPAGQAHSTFSYIPAPTINVIRPEKGQAGDSVDIVGTGLATTNAVSFGGTAVSVAPASGSDTSLTLAVPADLPPADCNTVLQVTVTTAGGTSDARDFAYACPSTG